MGKSHDQVSDDTPDPVLSYVGELFLKECHKAVDKFAGGYGFLVIQFPYDKRGAWMSFTQGKFSDFLKLCTAPKEKK